MVTGQFVPGLIARKVKLEGMLLDLLTEVISDLNPERGGGKISVSAYDTAWVARVRKSEDTDRLAYPLALEWLLLNQSSDGSWGGNVTPAYNLLPSMAALLALVKTPFQTRVTHLAAHKAESFLRVELGQFQPETFESSGFELLMPAMLKELEEAGITFKFPGKEILLRLQEHKLKLAHRELIYSGTSSLSHSLEAFGPSLDFERLKALQAKNGGYGSSPAATAAVLIYSPEWDSKAAGWLDELYLKSFLSGEAGRTAGSMPTAYPIDVFEVSWILYNLAHSTVSLKQLPQYMLGALTAWLEGSFTSEGVSISRFSGFPPDSDDTGMALATLKLAGSIYPCDSLFAFEETTHFACYHSERVVSIGANAHVLAALLSLSEQEKRLGYTRIEKVVNFLYSQRHTGGYWEDKWHLSPYYATACAVLALSRYHQSNSDRCLVPTLNWLLQTRNRADGGWSSQAGNSGKSNIEETAYALQTLRALERVVPGKTRQQYMEALYGGNEYLWVQLEVKNYQLKSCLEEAPRLWRAKVLYTPLRIVEAALLAALR
ncbi:MAG TPA: prenyltransferase/squalene oxidase repeat-containing protein [Chloroflexia bacterium]|nr:prenyltransferase/squalene oxidase repeat-containing protein [Chloroflexia bacterium]